MKFSIFFALSIFAICLTSGGIVQGQSSQDCKCCDLGVTDPPENCKKECEAENCSANNQVDDEQSTSSNHPEIAVASLRFVPTRNPCKDGFRIDDRKICRKVFQ